VEPMQRTFTMAQGDKNCDVDVALMWQVTGGWPVEPMQRTVSVALSVMDT
jgi:hypothetical protein